MALPTYATPADLRARLAVDAIALPDGKANVLLLDAEDWIDRIVGPITIDDDGRKFTPGNLSQPQRSALSQATVAVAAVMYGDANAFVTATSGKVSGPDFTIENTASLRGLSGPAVTALRTAAAKLDAARLRALRAALRR